MVLSKESVTPIVSCLCNVVCCQWQELRAIVTSGDGSGVPETSNAQKLLALYGTLEECSFGWADRYELVYGAPPTLAVKAAACLGWLGSVSQQGTRSCGTGVCVLQTPCGFTLHAENDKFVGLAQLLLCTRLTVPASCICPQLPMLAGKDTCHFLTQKTRRASLVTPIGKS